MILCVSLLYHTIVASILAIDETFTGGSVFGLSLTLVDWHASRVGR